MKQLTRTASAIIILTIITTTAIIVSSSQKSANIEKLVKNEPEKKSVTMAEYPNKTYPVPTRLTGKPYDYMDDVEKEELIEIAEKVKPIKAKCHTVGIEGYCDLVFDVFYSNDKKWKIVSFSDYSVIIDQKGTTRNIIDHRTLSISPSGQYLLTEQHVNWYDNLAVIDLWDKNIDFNKVTPRHITNYKLPENLPPPGLLTEEEYEKVIALPGTEEIKWINNTTIEIPHNKGKIRINVAKENLGR